MTKVSVIIPVYNVEEYLTQCLDNMINQTLKDIEIICIDDCSTDNSLQILQEYATKDNRIIVLRQEKNQGQGLARNRGLDIAKGEYIMFLDPDDWFELNACEQAYNKISKVNTDMCLYGFNRYFQEKDLSKRSDYLLRAFFKYADENGVVEIKNLDNDFIRAVFTVVYIYNADFLRRYNIRFNDFRIGEDAVFITLLYKYAKTLSIIESTLYNYRQIDPQEKSLGSTYDIQNFRHYFEAKKYAMQLLSDSDDNIKKAYAIWCIRATDYWYKKLVKFCPKIRPAYYKEMRTLYTELSKFYDLKNLKDYIKYKRIKKVIKYSYRKQAFFRFLKEIYSVRKKKKGTKKCTIITIFGIKIKKKTAFNYKSDCKKFYKKTYPEYCKKYKTIINRLRKKVKNNEKIKVCFLVSESSKWNMDSLYKELKESPYFEPQIIVTTLQQTTHRQGFNDVFNFYKSVADNVQKGWDDKTQLPIDLANFAPDIVFFQQSWDLYGVQEVEHTSNFALTCYCSYAIEDAITSLGKHITTFYLPMWRHFLFNEGQAKEFSKFFGHKKHNMKIVGHPKLDTYKDYKPEDYKHEYVIYAPHHSFEKDSLKYGTFRWNGKYILEWAKKHPEFKWVFKPHPRFELAVINNKIMSEKETEKYIKEWEKIGTKYLDGGYFDIFKNSRCLITDCGSFLTEYLPTMQPVIQMRNKDSEPFTATNTKIMKNYYQVYNKKQLEKVLNDVLIKGKDKLKNKREKVLEKLNLKNQSAAKNIIAELEKEILG
jgi:glycosyltransferase involved in cell wall biosynthesis